MRSKARIWRDLDLAHAELERLTGMQAARRAPLRRLVRAVAPGRAAAYDRALADEIADVRREIEEMRLAYDAADGVCVAGGHL